MEPSDYELDAAYSVFEQYNDVTAAILAEGVDGLSGDDVVQAIFSSVTTILIKLSIHFEVPKGVIIEAVADCYDHHNWATHGGNNVSRKQ